MAKIFSDFSEAKALFGKIFKSTAKNSIKALIQDTVNSLANKPAALGTETHINLNNSNFAPYNKAMINFKGPFTRIGKTAEDVPRTGSYFKYFESGYPLLGKYVPQGYYSVTKYTGKEIERYMTIAGCGSCSKLTMYDPVNKVGLSAHVDIESHLLNSKDIIKKSLLEKGAELKNLEVRHVAGMHEMPKRNKAAVRELMKELGLSEKQLIEESTRGGIHQEGSILDLKNGQTYELEIPFSTYYSRAFKERCIFRRVKPETKLNTEEIEKMNEEIRRMENPPIESDNNRFGEIK